jgi:hypothetical protein
VDQTKRGKEEDREVLVLTESALDKVGEFVVRCREYLRALCYDGCGHDEGGRGCGHDANWWRVAAQRWR